MVKHEAKHGTRRDSKSESKHSQGSQSENGKRSNWIPVLAVVLLAVGIFLVYSSLTTPFTTTLQSVDLRSGGETSGATGEATVGNTVSHATVTPQAKHVPASPQTSELHVQLGVGETPTPALAVECKLFKNKYTSAFKCFGCIAGVKASEGCVYTSRDWIAVASGGTNGGASGYSCVLDASYEFFCHSVKA